VSGFEQVQRAAGVDVKIVEGPRGGEVMTGLSGGVDNDGGTKLFDTGEDRGAVADVEFVMLET